LQGLHARVAKGNAASRVEDLGADAARRWKDERGKRLAHSAEMGAQGIGGLSQSRPSLRRLRFQGKRNLARFVPILWHSHSWLCGFRQFDSEFTDRPQNRRAWVPHPLRFLQRVGLDFQRDKKQWNLRQLGRKSSPLHNSRDSRIRPRTVRLHIETSESTLIESANIAQRRVAVPLYSRPCSCFSAHTTQWRAQGTASRRFC
jgi:hypothetical protein